MRRSSNDIDRLIADLQSSDSIRRTPPWRGSAFWAAAPCLASLISSRPMTSAAGARAGAQRARRHRRSSASIDVAFDALRDGDVDVVIAALGVLRGVGAPRRPARACWTRSPPSWSIARATRASAWPRSPRCPSCRSISSGRSATRRRRPKAPARRSTIRWRFGSGFRPTAAAPRSRHCTRSSTRTRRARAGANPRRACGGVAARRAASAHQALARRRQPRRAVRPPRDVRSGDGRRCRVDSVNGRGHRRCQLPRAAGPRVVGRAEGSDLARSAVERPPPPSCGARGSADAARWSRSCARIFRGLSNGGRSKTDFSFSTRQVARLDRLAVEKDFDGVVARRKAAASS